MFVTIRQQHCHKQRIKHQLKLNFEEKYVQWQVSF